MNDKATFARTPDPAHDPGAGAAIEPGLYLWEDDGDLDVLAGHEALSEDLERGRRRFARPDMLRPEVKDRSRVGRRRWWNDVMHTALRIFTTFAMTSSRI